MGKSEWVRTLLQLMKDMQFKDEGYITQASIDGRIVGECQNFGKESDKDVAWWKRELFRSMAWRTTSIVLRTKCGCTRFIESYEYPEYVAPIMPDLYMYEKQSDTFADSAQYTQRRFKYKGHRCEDTGCRLFEEVA